eukprot:TRINITY_DN4621_c0_g1_i2.p1 TRINITY_DN4621_c0_g1~~TRINITY_DN4621_c0_g1_i2.p1  ORF type:complete len:189 (-),score=53.03 TRINITY_DN4621_c0_g1_i2:10-498(-)
MCIRDRIRSMDTEFEAASSQSKNSLRNKLKKCKKEMDEAKRKVIDMETRVGGGVELRGKAENNMYRAAQQEKQLDNINKIAKESENIGAEVQKNLRGQRDVIINTTNMNNEITSELGKTNQIMNEMSCREYVLKIILYIAAFVLAFTDIFLVLLKLRIIRFR